jgi:hypothetical protein
MTFRRKFPDKAGVLNLALTGRDQQTRTPKGESVMLQSLARAVRDLQRTYGRALDSYRPELYYMRGPGPACRAKHTVADTAFALNDAHAAAPGLAEAA